MKKPFLVFCFGIFVFFLCELSYAQEQITITTYYPAPVGVYTELRATRLALGDNYFNPSTNVWGAQISATADLVVEGRVGIGTMMPDTTGLMEISAGNAGDAILVIEADEDNDNEGDNPGIFFKQDGNIRNAFIGMVGNAGTAVIGAPGAITDSLNNALVLGSELSTVPVQFATNDQARMTILTDGKVGIATNSPTAVLDVRGHSNTCIYIDYDAVSGNKTCPANYFMVWATYAQFFGYFTTTPELPGHFVCCNACADTSAAPDGICD